MFLVLSLFLTFLLFEVSSAMWWFSRCLFTMKPFLSNEILCLTLIYEEDKLAVPGPQPLLPRVPGCLRHI